MMEVSHPNWQIDSKLGTGTFSKVFSAYDVVSSRPVAIKYPIDTRSAALLETEAKTMSNLLSCEYIPKLIDASQLPKFIVMERVGQTLLQLHSEKGNMSMKTALMVGARTVEALEDMHKSGYVHRDVKPDNIAISLSPSDPKLFLIDVGLSYPYMRRGMHVTYTEGEDFQGTPFFCSLNAIRGVKCSRRDDLESLGYVLLFLVLGSLPWFQVEYPTRDALKHILRIREKASVCSLCQGLDPVFKEYLTYCRDLKFEEKPNYLYLKNMFVTAALRLRLNLGDGLYDWSPKPERKPHKRSLTRSSSSVRPTSQRSCSNLKRPSMNMSNLCLDNLNPQPGLKFKRQKDSLKLSSKTPSNTTNSTADGSSQDQITPKYGVDRLPRFRWPRKRSEESEEKRAEQVE